MQHVASQTRASSLVSPGSPLECRRLAGRRAWHSSILYPTAATSERQAFTNLRRSRAEAGNRSPKAAFRIGEKRLYISINSAPCIVSGDLV